MNTIVHSRETMNNLNMFHIFAISILFLSTKPIYSIFTPSDVCLADCELWKALVLDVKFPENQCSGSDICAVDICHSQCMDRFHDPDFDIHYVLVEYTDCAVRPQPCQLVSTCTCIVYVHECCTCSYMYSY